MEFGRAKQEEEIEFLRECHVLGMQQQKELAINACKDRQTEEEFRLFCNNWQSRFRPQINAILEDLQNQNIDENGVPIEPIEEALPEKLDLVVVWGYHTFDYRDGKIGDEECLELKYEKEFNCPVISSASSAFLFARGLMRPVIDEKSYYAPVAL